MLSVLEMPSTPASESCCYVGARVGGTRDLDYCTLHANKLANTTSTTYRKASEKAGAGWKTARRFYDKGREATAMRG